MAGAKTAKKLKRLVLAQSVAESLAKSHVGELSARQVQVDDKLEKARSSFANSQTSMLFSDLHLKHINGLVKQSEEVQRDLDAARKELQSETVRNKKLRERLKSTEAHENREAENKLLLERLDHLTGRR